MKDDFVIDDGIDIIRAGARWYRDLDITLDWHYLIDLGLPDQTIIDRLLPNWEESPGRLEPSIRRIGHRVLVKQFNTHRGRPHRSSARGVQEEVKDQLRFCWIKV